MARAEIGPEHFIMALALSSLAMVTASVETSRARYRRRHMKGLASGCDPGDDANLLHPQKRRSLHFHGTRVICQSPTCLERAVLECRVERWSASGEAHAHCRSDFVPPGFSFSHTEVRCDFLEGCIAKKSCRVDYDLEAGDENYERHRNARDGTDDSLVILCVLGFGCCIGFFFSQGLGRLDSGRSGFAPGALLGSFMSFGPVGKETNGEGHSGSRPAYGPGVAHGTLSLESP